MIWRLNDRTDFQRLRRHGRRARQGNLWISWVTDVTLTPPRVGYTVGRSVGRAVGRNRVRRRLRAIMTAVAREGRLPGGLYLVGARAGAAEQSFAQLEADTRHLAAIASGGVAA